MVCVTQPFLGCVITQFGASQKLARQDASCTCSNAPGYFRVVFDTMKIPEHEIDQNPNKPVQCFHAQLKRKTEVPK